MKSYCIKTDNEEIIEYILNKISKIDIPNIYYCNKSFKIYENVILHYTDNNVEQFNNLVAELITEVIIKFYQIKILKRIINVNYFYFDEFERKIILENCDEFIKQEEEKITETVFISVKEYILEHKSIVVEGVANFRINEYIKALDNIVDMAVNKYIIEKEYREFINLLKVYVNSTSSKTDMLHLIYTNGESILLDKDKNIIQIDHNLNNAKYLSDITFSSNDIALNTLLSLLPKKIEVHLINDEDEFINTLKLIFENRIKICTSCNICKTYRALNNMKVTR